MKQDQFLAYLKSACNGRQRTVRGAELEKALGVSGTDLRKLVNRLRRDGIPIGSSRDGYFYARTAGEVYTTIRQLHLMVKGLENAIRGLESALEKFQETDTGVPAETQPRPSGTGLGRPDGYMSGQRSVCGDAEGGG